MKLGDRVESLLTGEVGTVVEPPQYGELSVRMDDGRIAHAPVTWWMPAKVRPFSFYMAGELASHG